jgi:hypothetical protein
MKFRSILATGAIALAMVGGGVAAAGAASASTSSPATLSSYTPPGHFCNPWQLGRWTVKGRNTVNLTFQNSPFAYKVTFQQVGSCLRGWLTDGYYQPKPVTLAIYGTVYRNHITFSVKYPDTYRAVRTFTGTIGKWGAVSGTWSETGTEAGTGTWQLARNARPVHYWYWW